MDPCSSISYFTFIAIQAALRAGEILRRGFGTSYQIASKPGRQNFVTEYDRASEDCIISFINQHFPDHAILAEESGLSNSSSDTILWLIDPLDGTTNFAHHLPVFTISIAAYQQEQGLCGVIYQPLTQELFVAEAGKGAYLNGVPLAVSLTDQVEDALLAGGIPYVPSKQQRALQQLNHLISLGVTFRQLGSAALALAYVAAGKMDGFWMTDLYPWDVAAGQLIVKEAGGALTNLGKPHLRSSTSFGVLATNHHLHSPLLNLIKTP